MITRWTILAAVSCALLTFGPALLAQSEQAEQPATPPGGGRFASRGAPPPPKDEPEWIIESIQLQAADARTVAKLLSELFGQSQIIPAPHINSILLSCEKENVAIIREIAAKLDVESPPRQEQQLRVFPVKHRSAANVLNQIMLMSILRTTRLTRDAEGDSIFAFGDSETEMQVIESIIHALDTPTQSVSLEFTVFLADQSPLEAAAVIPTDLEEVAIELARFGHVKLLGRFHTVVVEGNTYQVKGTSFLGLEADLRGQVLSADKGQSVRVQLKGKIALKDIVEGEGKQTLRHGSFEIETTLALRPDEYVALGASAAGLTEGQSLILVARARP